MAGHGDRLLTYPEKFITVESLTSAGIQAAIDECVDGGSVFIPAGVYEITTAIIVPDKNLTIFGSRNSTHLKLSDNLPLGTYSIFYMEYDGSTIANMKLDGNKSVQANAIETYGIWLDGADHITIRDCEISFFKGTIISPGTGGDGIYITGVCDSILIDNNIIELCDDDGIDCESDSHLRYTRIVNNTIGQCGDNGIDTEGCDYCVISNNSIINCPGNGIEIEEESSGGGTCLHNTVTGNVVAGCGNGIALRSAKWTTVVSNALRYNGVGILIDKTGNGDNSEYNVIVGNVIDEYDDYGIQEIAGEADFNHIADNVITTLQIGAIADYDITGTNTTLQYVDGAIHKFNKGIAVTGNADADSITSRLATLTADGDAPALILVRGTDASPTANLMNVYKNDGATLLFGIQFDGRIYVASSSNVPTIVIGGSAGVGASVTVDADSTDGAGKITLVMGSSGISAGIQCTLTFSRAYNTRGIPSLTPANFAAAQRMEVSAIYCETPTPSTFTIWAGFNTLPVSSTLEFYYNVKGV